MAYGRTVADYTRAVKCRVYECCANVGVAQLAGCVLNCSHAARECPNGKASPQAREGKIMSNHLYANYLATDMEEASPRDKHLVIFSVSIVFADSCYTIAAGRDDCGRGSWEKHVDSYNYRQIMCAVCYVLRRACGYGSRYWSPSIYMEVVRNIRRQLVPYLPKC